MKVWMFFLLWTGPAVAQEELPQRLAAQLEAIAEAQQTEEVDEAFALKTAAWMRHPLSINDAGMKELEASGLVTPLQAAQLVRYREAMGRLVSLYELQAVPYWDLQTIRRIWPYLTLGNDVKGGMRERWKKAAQSIGLRAARVLEAAKGYRDTSGKGYTGDRNYIQLRYRAQYGQLFYLGLTAEKDAGEPFMKSGMKGFDFYSLHLLMRRLGRVEALALGDFNVNMGQGLVLWQSASFGRGGELAQLKRQAPVLEPYRSSGESGFSRGAGITMILNRSMELSAFYSRQRSSSSLSDSGSFSNLRHLGLHRTATELAQRAALGVQSAGLVLQYRGRHFTAGWNTAAFRFSNTLQKRPEPYNRFAPRGRQFLNTSLDYGFTHRNMHFFGEVAFDQAGHPALLHGALISLHASLDLGLVYRAIPARYVSIGGAAFTESGMPVNENGLYASLSFRPQHRVQVQVYADVFSFPWVRYRVDAPGRGRAFQLQLQFTPSRQSSIDLLYRDKEEGRNGEKEITYAVGPFRKQQFRLHYQSALAPGLTVKARGELCRVASGQEQEEGFLIYGEGAWKMKPLQVMARLQYFETSGFDSRIYAYESDLFGGSMPSVAGRGYRYYLILRYGKGDRFSAGLRLSQIIFNDRSSVGSGLDLIEGSRKTDVKMQVIYSF